MNRLLLLSLFFLLACHSRRDNDKIIIEGKVAGIPAEKVYLTDAYQWKLFIDSATYSDGKFVFNRPKDSAFLPFLASICFINKKGLIQLLCFKNDVLSTPAKEYGATSFVLEAGVTTITGIMDPTKGAGSNKLDLKAGKENEMQCRTQLLDFGSIFESDSAKRKARIHLFKSIIAEDPVSYYLLSTISAYRRLYSNAELSDLLASFDKSLLRTKAAIDINSLIAARPHPIKSFTGFTFANTQGGQQNLINSAYQLNLIILWASWCGPCLLEIPKLKQLDTKFRSKGLHLCSVSIDSDPRAWKEAISSEKMPWDQLLVAGKDLESFKNQFGVSAIPIVIICDRKGTELARFNGYDNQQSNVMENQLIKYLHQ